MTTNEVIALTGGGALVITVITLLVAGGWRLSWMLSRLFEKADNTDRMLQNIDTDAKETRAETRTSNEALRQEIRTSADRVVEALANHHHTDTDGSVVFTRPIN